MRNLKPKASSSLKLGHPCPGFARRVYAIVAKIPKGKTMEYKQVAAAAGSPRAYRAVGALMSRNHDPNIPCHRVIRADGKVGGYNRGGEFRKAKLLREEGFLQ